MLTLNVKETGTIFPEGWQEVTIRNADDTTFVRQDGETKRCIDLHFVDYPDTLKCRVFSAINSDTGEDFGIGNLFRYTNAGITTGETEDKLSVDDNATHLRGKKLHVFFYRNQNDFTDIVSRVVPVAQETDHEFTTFTHEEVTELKRRAERFHNSHNADKMHTNGQAEPVPF